MRIEDHGDAISVHLREGVRRTHSTFPHPLITIDHGDLRECQESELQRPGYLTPEQALEGANHTGDVLSIVFVGSFAKQLRDHFKEPAHA